jgi:mono/diheme cytochrome c family protein
MRYRSYVAPPMLAAACAAIVSCTVPPPDPQQALVERGREIFFNETFGGNGRTCGTCHREEANFALNPALIATLPPNDPLFVAEFVPALRENFEKPRLMREFADPENPTGSRPAEPVRDARRAAHARALRSRAAGPRTGWLATAPRDGTLRLLP